MKIKMKKKNLAADIIAIGLLVLSVYLLNRQIRISGFFMDDMYTWSCFRDQTLKEFMFPAESVRFRPFFWLLSWLELSAIGNHLELIVPINMAIIAVSAAFAYLFMADISGSRIVSFLAALAIAASRFAYYDVGQLLGILESVPMLLTIFMCMELFYFMRDGKESRFYLALLCYVLACFTHERYMVLIPMFFYVLIASGDKKVIRYVIAAAGFVFILCARLARIGTLLPAGTGGTEVADTFTFAGFYAAVKQEIKYLLGINAGPMYLCGIPWEMVDARIKIMVYAGIALIAVLTVVFIIRVIQNAKNKSGKSGILNFLFFLGFIIGLVFASSVTIRVELRWLYTPFVMMLFLILYMLGYLKATSGKPMHFMTVLVAVIMLLFTGEDIYYRTGWDYIYLFPAQAQYNSLADTTWGKYREAIFDKDIYIIGNAYDMSEFTDEYFFKVYDETGTREKPHVIHVESESDIPENAWKNDIILREDPENNAFVEVKHEQ